jgi:predicted TIM-barrel fold metal-dependent hydrolase
MRCSPSEKSGTTPRRTEFEPFSVIHTTQPAVCFARKRAWRLNASPLQSAMERGFGGYCAVYAKTLPACQMKALFACIGTTAALVIVTALSASAAGTSETSRAVIPIIDTHAHPFRGARRGHSTTANQIVNAMDDFGVEMTILLPPPFPSRHPALYGRGELKPMVHAYPERLAFAAGGESLNAMLHDVPSENVTPRIAKAFRDEAEAIANAGAAGYGEFATEHFSSGIRNHPYESARPDHPLLLLLADIAAEHDMPIDIHMEAVPHDMLMPGRFSGLGPNPASLKENISGFERLLAHNAKTRIIWAHAGWDNTGERTVPLMRRLLNDHPNLYMSIKIDEHAPKRTSPLDLDGTLRPGWLALLRDFSDRFLIGSDQFFDDAPERLALARRFVDALPPEIARRVANENARRVYRLGPQPK